MKDTFCRDTKHKYYFTVDKNVTKCRAITHYFINDMDYILIGEGYARCSPDDKFNYRFGCELAKARAKKVLAKKIERTLMRFSYTRSRELAKEKKNEIPIVIPNILKEFEENRKAIDEFLIEQINKINNLMRSFYGGDKQ